MSQEKEPVRQGQIEVQLQVRQSQRTHTHHYLPFTFAFLVSVVLILGIMFGVRAQNLASPPDLLVSGPQQVRVGEPFSITIGVSTGYTLAAYEVGLQWDTTLAHLRSLEHTTHLSHGTAAPLGPMPTLDGVAFGAYSCVHPCPAAFGAKWSSDPSPPDFALATLTLVADRPGVLKLTAAHGRVVEVSGLIANVPQGVPLLEIEARLVVPDPAIPAVARRVVLVAAPAIPPTAPETGVPEIEMNITGEQGGTQADVALAWSAARRRGVVCTPAPMALPESHPNSHDVNGDGCLDVVDLYQITALSAAQVADPALSAQPAEEVTASGVFTVTTVSDAPDAVPGDRVCATADGSCSLRAAIAEANAHQGADAIHFDLPGEGVRTIHLARPLPTLSDLTGGTTLDGYTQVGATLNSDPSFSNAILLVQLRGSEPPSFDALDITSPGNIIRGLAFFNFIQPIELYGYNAHDNRIVGNFIGTDAIGETHATQAESFVGGVALMQGAARNQIGGPALMERNVISGNPWAGVILYHQGTEENIIQNNIIGLTPGGDSALPNLRHGVDINLGASRNIVGGASGEGNVIAGNDEAGVEISHGNETRANQVVGNRIGTDVTGNHAGAYSANGDVGVNIEDGVRENLVAGNIIGNNLGGGIALTGPGTASNTVRDNRIGISLNGSAIPNSGYGVSVQDGVKHSQIGPGNMIANNWVGVLLWDQGTDFNTITQNAIYANSTLGIDLEPLGVNQTLFMPVAGPNQQLPAPVLTGITQGQVTGSACLTCTVEIFRDQPSVVNSAQGRVFLGAASVSAEGRFSITIRGVLAGDALTATATDASGNTSEFSLPLRVEEQVGEVLYLPHVAGPL
jgi:CSLREA domain-containing protein